MFVTLDLTKKFVDSNLVKISSCKPSSKLLKLENRFRNRIKLIKIGLENFLNKIAKIVPMARKSVENDESEYKKLKSV